MAVSKQKKFSVIEDLKKIFASGAEVVFTNFHGLNVTETTSLRRKMKEAGVSYRVAKKTLVKKALTESGFREIPELPGEISLVYAKDVEPLEAGRQTNAVQKEYKDKFSITGGIFEGRLLGQEEMVSLSKIPSKQTLYAQFVNVINSPIQGLAIAISKIAEGRE